MAELFLESQESSSASGVKVPPRSHAVWKTPMFEQYWKIKETVPEILLFYRMGDFYELFGADAVSAAPCLEVQLTARNRDAEVPVPMCGVPAHAVDSYAEKLLSKGFKVALCEQLEEAGTGKSKLVERGIIRVLTPGLPIDFERLNSKTPHWFLSISKSNRASEWDVCALDFLASDFYSGIVRDHKELQELVERLDPKEILVPSGLSLKKELSFLEEPSEFYSRITPWAGQQAKSNLEEYLLYTQRCRKEDLPKFLPEPKHISQLSGVLGKDHAYINHEVLEQWAVLPELFHLLDDCGSAVGSRRLRMMLSTPLSLPEAILCRQQVWNLLESKSAELQKAFRELYDLERLLGRIRVGAAQPKELLRLLRSLQVSHGIFARAPIQETLWSAFLKQERFADPDGHYRHQVFDLTQKLDQTLNSDVDAERSPNLSDLIRAGFSKDFDTLKNIHEASQQWLVDFENRERERTGIASLKVRYNRVFGYYIEITKTHLAKVPQEYDRKQTTVNGERFTTAELRQKERDILEAESKAEKMAAEIFANLNAQINEHASVLKLLTEELSWLDALAGAQCAIRKASRHGAWKQAMIEPNDSQAFYLSLVESRHPLIESRSHFERFVPNSVELGKNHAQRILLLTGPNMAGKSTLMRQSGLCLLLAQCGLPVPAESMTFYPCSGFYSRMGASDRILDGESTFMVEMKETAEILSRADSNSFVLVDEIGRGTSNHDGLSIAKAVLKYMSEKIACVCIFATHYHELSDLALELKSVFNGSMGIEEWQGDLVFLRKLQLKPAESSYGIYVAKLAGLPKQVIRDAQDYFQDQLSISPQMGLFQSTVTSSALPKETRAEESPFLSTIAELQKLDMSDLSPKQAWLELERIVEHLKLSK